LQRRLGIAAIHVTHDREEAMVMADRIVIVNAGQVEQEGTPEDVYNRPASPFVAKFMGADNVVDLPATVSKEIVVIPAGPHNDPAQLRRADRDALPDGEGSDMLLAAYFRSEAAELLDAAGGNPASKERAGDLVLSGHVVQASYPGGTWRHTVRVGEREFRVDAPRRHVLTTRVRIRLPAEAVFLFPAEDGLRQSRGELDVIGTAPIQEDEPEARQALS
jgi:ABC-type Fe3+/spermidine/putrescine transport system ATPase subunit